jgi:hypothetical protein
MVDLGANDTNVTALSKLGAVSQHTLRRFLQEALVFFAGNKKSR